MDELLPKLRTAGYTSEADIIRTALFEFMVKHSDSRAMKMLALATRSHQKYTELIESENTFVTDTTHRIAAYLREGFTQQAIDLLRETETHLDSFSDDPLSAYLRSRLHQDPNVKSLLSTIGS